MWMNDVNQRAVNKLHEDKDEGLRIGLLSKSLHCRVACVLTYRWPWPRPVSTSCIAEGLVQSAKGIAWPR